MHSPTVALDRSEKVSPFFADELTYVRTALGGRLGEGGVRRPVAVITLRRTFRVSLLLFNDVRKVDGYVRSRSCILGHSNCRTGLRLVGSRRSRSVRVKAVHWTLSPAFALFVGKGRYVALCGPRSTFSSTTENSGVV